MKCFHLCLATIAFVVGFKLDMAAAADDAQQALEAAKRRYQSSEWQTSVCTGIPERVMGVRVRHFDEGRRVILSPVEDEENTPRAYYREYIDASPGQRFEGIVRFRLLDENAHRSNLFRVAILVKRGDNLFHVHLVGFADQGTRLYRIAASGRDEKTTTEFAHRVAMLAQRTIAANVAERKRIGRLIDKMDGANVGSPAARARRAEFIRVAFADLSDDELLKHYEVAGLTLQHGSSAVTDEPFSGPGGSGSSAERYLADVRVEIVRRGRAIVPELIEFLRNEISRRRPRSDSGPARPGFAGDSIDLLVKIRDPRPVKLLVEIVGGLGGKAFHRRAAFRALERYNCVV